MKVARTIKVRMILTAGWQDLFLRLKRRHEKQVRLAIPAEAGQDKGQFRVIAVTPWCSQ